MGKAQGGGSGWVLLAWSARDNKLINTWAADHTCNLAGAQPILGLYMYEHSHHMNFGEGGGLCRCVYAKSQLEQRDS